MSQVVIVNIRERAWDLELFDDHLEGAESKFPILAPYCEGAKVYLQHDQKQRLDRCCAVLFHY